MRGILLPILSAHSRLLDIPVDRIEGIWRQVLDVLRGSILADWLAFLHSCSSRRLLIPLSSAAESFTLEMQDAEENFDLSLLAALEIDVVPHLGNARLRDSLGTQLASVLLQGSRIYERETNMSPKHADNDIASKVHKDFEEAHYHREYGSTHSGILVPRERFSYWCFDLLFLICGDTTKGVVGPHQSVNTLTIV